MNDEQYARAVKAAYRQHGPIRMIDLALWYDRIGDQAKLQRLRWAVKTMMADG